MTNSLTLPFPQVVQDDVGFNYPFTARPLSQLAVHIPLRALAPEGMYGRK